MRQIICHVFLPLVEYKWCEWSRDKHNTERHNMLRFRVMA